MIYETDHFPTWALPIAINDDPSGLTDEDVEDFEYWVERLKEDLHTNWISICAPDDFETPSFDYFPEFGGACDTIHIKILF